LRNFPWSHLSHNNGVVLAPPLYSFICCCGFL
jgi:hypothetical protein